jgi:hypothetical protein
MARFVRISGLAALMVFCWSATAQGFGWRIFGFRTCNYYRPVQVLYYPAYVVPCYPAAVPVPQYAMPKAAPASQTGEPPLGSAKPKITDSRSHGGQYAAVKGERCRVGFWNITGRDVTILVDGQSRALARNQSLTLDVARAFRWQMDGREQNERVPDGQTTFEIVLRQ